MKRRPKRLAFKSKAAEERAFQRAIVGRDPVATIEWLRRHGAITSSKAVECFRRVVAAGGSSES